MAALNFPDSPIHGDYFTAGGIRYRYDDTKKTWNVAPVVGAATIDDLADINLTVQPESIALNVDSPGPGHEPTWLWTWEQSTLPFSRIAITNSPQQSVPVYQQGTYQINNFAKTVHGEMTQAHSFKLKWIEGAGDANLINWATYSDVTMSHPDINDGADQLVTRLSFTVPDPIVLPTLVAPNVTYDVAHAGVSDWDFSGTHMGGDPDLGPFYRGGTYTFNINASGHPFYLTTDNGTGFESGSYVGEWTDGVTGSRTDVGTITFVVPQNAPDVLYYQCGNHANMRGTIKIKDLAVETNENGNYIIYGQHSQDGHVQPMEIRPLPELASQMCIVYDKTLDQWMPQDLATYVENTPSFENKIKEVAGTATLVAPDGTSMVASVDIYSTSSYLPQIGNTNGDIAFVEDVQELKIWKTGTGWLDVAAATTNSGGGAGSPTITGVSPANYNGADQTEFTISGTNFTVGSVVDFITANGATYRASTTSIIDQANLTAVTPQAFLESDGPLDIKITTTGGDVTALDMIQTGGSPVWTTASGTLYQNAFPDDVAIGEYTYRLEGTVDETVAATDPDGQPVTYTLVSGTLPPNCTLNSLTGNISGNLPNSLPATTTYSFTLSANDSSGNATHRDFNIQVKNQAGNLYPFSTHTFTTGGSAITSINDWRPQTLSTFTTGYSGAPFLNDTSKFNVVNGMQFWAVPVTGTFEFEVAGGCGGVTIQGQTAGQGAKFTFRKDLQMNDILCIVVGGRGGNYSHTAGGGGASYVCTASSMTDTTHSISDVFVIAAGGGGGGNSGGNGYNASLTETISSGHSINDAVTGGAGGNPNGNNGGWGAGGAGWLDNGDGNTGDHSNYQGGDDAVRLDGVNGAPEGASPSHNAGWTSKYHDWSGSGSCHGAPGGFGGGGSGACNGGGGGGGYNGGNGSGSGGGSHTSNVTIISQGYHGSTSSPQNGYVKITLI